MFYKKIKNNKACLVSVCRSLDVGLKFRRSGGFTLIELLAVIAIFGILTAITVGNYSKFTSDVVLTNMAYELALSIREAQVYGISVANQGGESFDKKYGINFVNGQSDYFLFVDQDNNNNYILGTELKKTYTLQKGVKVNGLRVGCFNQDRINILFKRPNLEPIIPDTKSNDLYNKSAQIELLSREGNKKYVIVSGSGQIYVSSEDKISELCPI